MMKLALHFQMSDNVFKVGVLLRKTSLPEALRGCGALSPLPQPAAVSCVLLMLKVTKDVTLRKISFYLQSYCF